MLIYLFIGAAAGIVIASVVLSLIFIPKTRQSIVLDEQMREQNQQTQQEILINQEKIANLSIQYDDLARRKEQTNNEIKELFNNLVEQQNKAEEQANSYYESYMEQAKLKSQTEEKEIQEKFQSAIEDYKNEYQAVLEQSAQEFISNIQNYREQLDTLGIELDTLKTLIGDKSSEYKIFTESLKKAQEDKEKQKFYQLQISKEDIEEIEIIRSIIPRVRNADPINKIIYKTYYEKAYTDLTGRVIGAAKTCGIYKITNLVDGMAYIGQSVDVAERWRQHIKCGCGIDAPNNKLYKAMYEIGVENFSFEILEKCDKILLNDKEKLWINNFETNVYGYNMTAGGSK